MKVLNLLSAGHVGGIEVLCKDIAMNADYDNSFCFLFEEGQIYDEMKAYTKVVSLKNVGKKFSLKKLIALLRMAKEYDVIVTHHANIPLQLYYFLICLFNRKAKKVMVAHSCFEREFYYSGPKLKRLFYAWLLNQDIKKTDKIIFVSQAGKISYLKEFSIKEAKTAVIYNGISDKKINLINNINDEYLRLTYIGRLVEVKGVQHLLGAVKILENKGLKLKLTIVGDGDYRTTLEEMAKQYQLVNVRFEGTQRSLEKYYEQTNIFVYPSICEEVFGISLVEAMAKGIPCAAFKVGGIPEIIKDEYNGILCENISDEGLADAILKLNDLVKINSDTIHDNCLKTAKLFSINNTIKMLKECFIKLLKDGK